MKPESILAHEPQVLTQAQKKTYFNDGYLVLEEFIDPEWMKRIWDTTNEFIEESRSYKQSDSKFDLDQGHSSETLDSDA